MSADGTNPPASRRERRRSGLGQRPADPASSAIGMSDDDASGDELERLLSVEAASPAIARPALGWVDPASLEGHARRSGPPDESGLGPLVSRWPSRRPSRASVLTPLAVALSAAIAYTAVTLLWPLTAVQPHVEAVAAPTATAVAAAPLWPGAGQAAVSVVGAGTVSSGTTPSRMASIAKVLTAAVVLEARPLSPGQQGDTVTITAADRAAYLADKAGGESTLPFAVGDTLSEYQLLQGMLLGSAGNYADKLVASTFPSESAYLQAARAWLEKNGISGITITDNTGFGRTNTATAEALTALAAKAMADPVIAEIVAQREVQLPTAGAVANTNELLGDPGVIGMKTGTLDGAYNLLVAQDLAVGGTTLRIYVSILGQPTDEVRWSSARALLASVDRELEPTAALSANTIVGHVTTAWGSSADIVTATDARIVLWNGASASTSPALALRDDRAKDASAGDYTVTGPLDSATVSTRLTAAVPGPSPWWRMTHPLELFGLTAWR